MIAPAPAPTRNRRAVRTTPRAPESTSEIDLLTTSTMSAVALYSAILNAMRPLISEIEGGTDDSSIEQVRGLIPACRAVAKLIAYGQSTGIINGAADPSVTRAHDSIMGALALAQCDAEADSDLRISQEMAAINLVVRAVDEFSAVPLSAWIELDRAEAAYMRSRKVDA